ncbi:MAG: Aminopeptidase YpdF (MP-, MA-, MS-, AP-, NP-specific) [uncultured Campylobacterales bacterium]|uniref:Aminopeptidase YpdF (MP-, MA-, MS-, AP-, NP-specific) n=1 Tax=uncultured Campylobacterales bacterium TaxID=352960 RepID=A0A6S6SEJ4_9BACT|nr:MAG: Aminopeptidase YpdF (MP-, MA-, MS-, AP-, NP-specific) [uncultured Campylobacterales bacterium]
MNLIFTNENAIKYECGYTCDNAVLLMLGGEKTFITDSRYESDAKEKLNNTKLLITRDLLGVAIEELNSSKIKTLEYNPHELSAYQYQAIKSKTDIDLIAKNGLSQKRRIIKSYTELEYLQESIDLNAKAFNTFAKFIKTYLNNNKILSEKELFFHAKNILSYNGKYDLSFDPITAIKENSALPHAHPTHIEYSTDDILLFDAGIKYKGYCSDRTRTTSINNDMNFDKYNQKFKDSLEQKVYDTVLKAQENAMKVATVGAKASDIDKAARDTIDKAGFGKYFIHSTGHGVGLDIHELPVISTNSDTIIEENMAFTIEPGIYLPKENGKKSFGVRIEDIVIT